MQLLITRNGTKSATQPSNTFQTLEPVRLFLLLGFRAYSARLTLNASIQNINGSSFWARPSQLSSVRLLLLSRRDRELWLVGACADHNRCLGRHSHSPRRALAASPPPNSRCSSSSGQMARHRCMHFRNPRLMRPHHSRFRQRPHLSHSALVSCGGIYNLYRKCTDKGVSQKGPSPQSSSFASPFRHFARRSRSGSSNRTTSSASTCAVTPSSSGLSSERPSRPRLPSSGPTPLARVSRTTNRCPGAATA